MKVSRGQSSNINNVKCTTTTTAYGVPSVINKLLVIVQSYYS